uniref:Centromere-associated protein E n=1 Tax=Lepeophtheirus salmonis TaxID=72036 RepID=A0A0K2TD80_LEPSM
MSESRSGSQGGSESVQVGIRIRSLIPREIKAKKEIKWLSWEDMIWSDDKKKSYRFDQVFDANSRNEDIFSQLCTNIIHSAFRGFNGTIFAYGQTSSGKTHTMMGDEDEAGVIPAAIDQIFASIEATQNREFLLRVSYLEIYNENIVDLLAYSGGSKKYLQLKEDTEGNVWVDGATEEIVSAPEEVIQCLLYGEQHRHIGSTNMNKRSSRSHTIFRLIIESSQVSSHEGNGEPDGAITVSHLNLVDLAGSERVEQTGSTGERLREGGNINKSLLVLSQVISKLSEGSRDFVPFRDSKLTRILKNSLGGNARTAIICTVTPVEKEQTKSTLEFASRAKNIVQHAKVNEVLDDQTQLKRLKKEIIALQRKLEEEKNGDRVVELEQLKSVITEKDRQIEEKERQMASERERLCLDMKDQEEQLQVLRDRLLSGQVASPSTSQLFEEKPANKAKYLRRETWAASVQTRKTRRMSFFPKIFTKYYESNGNDSDSFDMFNDDIDSKTDDLDVLTGQDLSIFESVDDIQPSNNYISQRSRRKTVRFGEINYKSDEENEPLDTSSMSESPLNDGIKRPTDSFKISEKELSELQEFIELGNTMKASSPQKSFTELKEQLRNTEKSKSDMESLYFVSNKELHEVKSKMKDLENEILNITEENCTKESLRKKISELQLSNEQCQEKVVDLDKTLKITQEKLNVLEKEKGDFEVRMQLSEESFKKKELELIQSLNEERKQTNLSNGSWTDSSPFGDVTLTAIEELTRKFEELQNYANDLENEVRLNKISQANDLTTNKIDEDEKNNEVEMLQNELQECRNVLNDKQAIIEKLEEKIEQLELNKNIESINQMNKELTEYEEKIAELNDNALVILNDYETLEKEKIEMENENVSLKKKLTYQEANRVNEIEAKLTNTNEIYTEKNLIIEELTKELQCMKDEKIINESALNEKIKLLETSFKNIESEEQSSPSSQVTNKLSKCADEIQEKNIEISKLSSRIESQDMELEKLNANFEQLKGLKNDLENKISTQQRDLDEKCGVLEENNTVIDGLKIELQKLTEQKHECESLSNAEIQRMKETVEKLESESISIHQGIQEKDNAFTLLEFQYKSLTQENKQSIIHIDEIEASKTSLENQVKELQKSFELSSTRLDEAKIKIAENEKEMNLVNTQLITVTDEKEEWHLRFDELHNLNHSFAKEIEILRSSLDGESSKNNMDFKLLEGKNSELESSLKKAQLSIEDQGSNIHDLQLKLKYKSDELNKLENNISLLNEQKLQLLSDVESYKKTSRSKEDEIKELQQSVDSLINENRDLTSRYDVYCTKNLQMESDLNEYKNELRICELNTKELQSCVESYEIELENVKFQLGESSRLQSILDEGRNKFEGEKIKHKENILTHSSCKEEEIAHFKIKCNKLENEMSKLKHDDSAFVDLKSANSELSSKITSLSSQIKLLMYEKEKINEDLVRLTESNENVLQTKQQEILELKETINSILKDYRKEIEDTHNEYKEKMKSYLHDGVSVNEEIASLQNLVKSKENDTALLSDQVNLKKEAITCLENKLSQESVALSEILNNNNKLILEIEELKKLNRQLENNILEVSESQSKKEFDKLRHTLKSCKLELASTQVESTFKDKEIDILRKDVIFFSKKSNTYKEELRKVRNENMDTTIYNNESKLKKRNETRAERQSEVMHSIENTSSQVSSGGIVEELCLNIKEYEINRLKKEIEERKAHEESVLSAYKKWKKIAMQKEEELKELQLKLA